MKEVKEEKWYDYEEQQRHGLLPFLDTKDSTKVDRVYTTDLA